MVFIDDSAVECQLVRDTLPMVDVLQAPASAYQLPALLRSYRGFTYGALTDEDRGRTASYLAERQRQVAARKFTDMDAFLASLDLEVEIGAPRADEMDRVVQLLQRTNQFNLTTRRHTLADVLRLAADSDAAILVMKVRDRYGEYGLTGLAIATRTAGEAAIDSFLMSCRVLGRKVEDVLLTELLATIRRRWGNVHVTAEFQRTEKNMQVTEFFDTRSFRVIASNAAHKRYEAEAALTPTEPPSFIAITRRDDA